MALEIAAHHLAVPAPVVMRVGGGMHADDALAGLEKADQRIAPCAGEPFGIRFLRVGGAAHEHDGLVGSQLFRREHLGILAHLMAVAQLGRQLFQRLDAGRDRVVPIAGAAGVDEHAGRIRGHGYRGR
jgi:hypothetical protein